MHVPLVIGDFLERSELFGDRTALVDEPGVAGDLGRVSFARAGRPRARGMGRWLDAAGVGPGERVTIVTPNAARMTIAYLGVCAHGRVLVPVNFRLSPGDVAEIVARSGTSALLVDPELDEALAEVRPPRPGGDGRRRRRRGLRPERRPGGAMGGRRERALHPRTTPRGPRPGRRA